MCVRYLGLFLLLAWLPDLLQAELPCSPPELPDGYFVPEKNTYPHGETLTYSCEADFKPVVEGWWATSKCQNGKWSHTPQCIDKNSCLPPTIPNGKLEERATSQNGWYEENLRIPVTCEDGFLLKGNPRTARCQNGEWSLPVCEKNSYACGEPDQIPHAVIINQAPKEVYAHNSELQYECENGYNTGQPMNRGTITCNRGTWTSGPPCSESCMLDPTGLGIRSTSPIALEEGKGKYIHCNRDDYFVYAICSGGRIQRTNCEFKSNIIFYLGIISKHFV
uniref:Sushi domain-containing protein n=1 Tax=Cyprinodon variegatus TaxID=28743 RepID=A0A3Q2FMZ8_CYPVA